METKKVLIVKNLTESERRIFYNLIINNSEIKKLSMQEEKVFAIIASHHICHKNHDHSTIQSLAHDSNLTKEFTEVCLETLINKGMLYLKGNARFVNFDFFQNEVNQILKENINENKISEKDEYIIKVYHRFREFMIDYPRITITSISESIGLANSTISMMRSAGKGGEERAVKYSLESWKKIDIFMNESVHKVISPKNKQKRTYIKKEKQLFIANSDKECDILNLKKEFDDINKEHSLESISSKTGIPFDIVLKMKCISKEILLNIEEKYWKRFDEFMIEQTLTPFSEIKMDKIENKVKEEEKKPKDIGKEIFIMGRIGSTIYLPYGIKLEIEIGEDCTTVTEFHPTKGKRGTMYIYYK